MNSEQSIKPDIGVVALAQLQLSDWQFMLAQQQATVCNPDDIHYARRQIARLEAELSYDHSDTAPASEVVEVNQRGLSKREYIATALLSGMLAANPGTHYNLALQAVELADDLISALNQ